MVDQSILYQTDDVSYALTRLGLDRDGLVECVRVAGWINPFNGPFTH
jgi:hypothetical protein